MRKAAITSFLFLILILSACQNDAFTIDATIIKAYNNQTGQNTGKHRFTIEDEEVVQSLLDRLQMAATKDVSSADMAAPDLYLDFIHNNEVVLTIGYYQSPMDGARYLYKNKLYKEKMTIP